MKGAFTPEFTPIARPGQFIEVDEGGSTTTYRIDRFAPLPTITSQTLSVNDGAESSKYELSALETDNGWLAQYRPVALTQELPDGVVYELYQPGEQDPLYTNKTEGSEVGNDTPYQLVDEGNNAELDDLTHLLELFVESDDVPYIQFTNTSGSDQSFTLTFAGFNFAITEVANPNKQPVYVPVAAVRGGV